MTQKTQKTNRGNLRLKSQLPRLAIIFTGVVLFLLVLLIFQQWPNRNGSTTLPPEIRVSRAYEEFQTGAVLVDVREQVEWDEYHVPNSIHIPLAELKSRSGELPKDQDILVICRSGNRSKTGRDILMAQGFSNVTSVTGGLKDWKAAGYPIVIGD